MSCSFSLRAEVSIELKAADLEAAARVNHLQFKFHHKIDTLDKCKTRTDENTKVCQELPRAIVIIRTIAEVIAGAAVSDIYLKSIANLTIGGSNSKKCPAKVAVCSLRCSDVNVAVQIASK